MTRTERLAAATDPLSAAEPVAIGMGSNLGDRPTHLRAAAQALKALPHCTSFRFSAIYETAAVACPEPLPFLNAVALCHCRLPPEVLLFHLQAIERRSDRRRPYPNAPRTLDLDMLLFGARRVETAGLVLPHPRMAERLFVLAPLNDVWREALHPVTGETAAAMLHRQQDREPQGVISLTRFGWEDEHHG